MGFVTGKNLRLVATFFFLIHQILISPVSALAVGEIQPDLISTDTNSPTTPYDNNNSVDEQTTQQNQPNTTIDFLADATSLETSADEISGTAAGLSGGDGTVDGSDYVIWRKFQGSTGPNNPGDFNKDGIVDNADYDFWRSRFGATITDSFRALNIFEWIDSQHDFVSGTFEMLPGAPVSTYTYLLVDPPDHGTLQINGANYTYTPTLGYYGNDSFSFQVMNNTGTYSFVATGQILGLYGLGQTAVVIDSGIDYLHTSLGGGFGPNYRVVAGYDFMENDNNPMDDQVGLNGHGTHVAGIIGSDHTTYTGVAPLVDLVALRVFNDAGQNWSTDTEDALMWILNRLLEENAGTSTIENPITTVNMSITYGGNYASGSGPSWSSLFDSFMNMLKGEGLFIAAAAGNCFNLATSCGTTYGTPGLTYPASSAHVVPVMSTNTWTSGLSNFSQRYGSAIAADGYQIWSTVPDWRGNNNGIHTDDFESKSGTSMSSPFIAGAAILIREAFNYFGNTNLNQNIINQHMRSTADTFFDSATSANYLRLNLDRAIDSIFHPDDYASINFSYLQNAGISFGLSSGSGMGATLADFVEELLAPPPIKASVGFLEQMASRQPAHFTYQPAALPMVGGSANSEESEFGNSTVLDTDKSETESFTSAESRLKETLLNNLSFESWDFQSMKNYMLFHNPVQSNVMIEQLLHHNLKGELVGSTLWIWDEHGNLVARTALPPWMLFALKSNPNSSLVS